MDDHYLRSKRSKARWTACTSAAVRVASASPTTARPVTAAGHPASLDLGEDSGEKAAPGGICRGNAGLRAATVDELLDAGIGELHLRLNPRYLRMHSCCHLAGCLHGEADKLRGKSLA
jgi:hypothetical protein